MSQKRSLVRRPSPRPEGPDNRAGWDAIAAAYQRDRGWPMDRLAWGVKAPFEDELKVLGGIRGKSVLVLGCGGGQDCVALSRMGAREITGVDVSQQQLEHAVKLLDEQGVAARMIHGSAEDLSAVLKESIDVAVSIHALNYVEDAARCFKETERVLRPGGLLAFSVQHPADASTVDEPPFGFEKPYFQVEFDWNWKNVGDGEPRFRSYYRTIGDWCELLRTARFTIERVLEPRPVDDPAWHKLGWASMNDYVKYDTVPGTLILAARKRKR
jgi:ubiquinone/menaquinone biosynthesis C-methylase UbiE